MALKVDKALHMDKEFKLKYQLQKFADNCDWKREILSEQAYYRTRDKKILTSLSGILSLLSAGTIATVLSKSTTSTTLQIISAILAAISGIISIVIVNFYDEESTSKILQSTSQYLHLRDKANNLILKPNVTNEEVFDELTLMYKDYSELDKVYSSYAWYKRRTRPTLSLSSYHRNQEE